MSGMVTWFLLGTTILVSWVAWQQPRLLDRLILWAPAVDRLKQYDRLLTHGFIHANGMHLIFNMVTLYSFGMMMEGYFTARIGKAGYLFFYLSAVVVAILPTYLRHKRDASYRSLGASGAVSAVLFSSILLDPWALIIVFVVPMPAFVFAGLYIGYSVWMDKRGGDNVNHSAHLWGALYGLMFSLLQQPQLAAHFVQRLASPHWGGG